MSGADRISELPEAILHHILSYLPIRDAARTSLLSKWWNNAWETLPYLNFNDDSFMFCNGELRENRDLLVVVQRIVRSRSRQHISIKKFSLFLLPWQDELLEMHHDLPLHWLSPSEEEERSRCREGFDLSSSWSSILHDDIRVFTRLQKLALKCVDLDDSLMENLISGSRSSLETLELKFCEGLNTIHLGGEFVKLKQLMVHLSTEVALEVYDAPELEDLQVFGYSSSKFTFNMKNCPRLRKVFLDCESITENNLHQLLASSKHLEELSISKCSLLNKIRIYSDSLKTLSLSSMTYLLSLHIFSPTLKNFTFDRSTPYLMNDFSFNGSDGINLITTDVAPIIWLRLLPHFKHVKTLTLTADEIDINPGLRAVLGLSSPLYGTRDISFFSQAIRMEYTIPELVEYLLWLAPRAERVSILSSPTPTLLSLELLYHDEYEGKKHFHCSCCQWLPVDCWRHCLKEVKIQKFEESECNLAMMTDFFLKEIKNLKIMNNVT